MSSDIKNLFSRQNILEVARMRDKFFSTGSTEGITGVRDEILHGWKASYARGYVTPNFQKPRVTDLPVRLQKSEALLSAAIPYMKNLYSFLHEKSFWITLLDKDGVILKLVGSDDILDELAATGLVEGSNRGSDAPYCGLFHLVYTYKRPFLLGATEHASPIDDNLAGGACPITDVYTKDVMGFIAVSGHWWDSHHHTLGLAVISAGAISKQMALENAARHITALNRSVRKVNYYLQTTLDSLQAGIIYCTEDGRIKVINQNAVKLLGIKGDAEHVIGKLVCPYLDDVLTMEKVAANTKQGGTYYYEIVRSGDSRLVRNRNYLLYCVIRSVTFGDKEGEYLITLSKQAETHLSAAKVAFSDPTFSFSDIIGSSDGMMKAKRIADIGAQHDPAILITGETGTGKELFAQAIHNASPRRNGPFIAVNCGAIPRTLIESELFGYEKGAFTGADKKGHPGKFELANGGTLFLDEIGDMPYDVQVTLLRVLQTHKVVRVGGTQEIHVNVRIISATNKDLRQSIRNHTFRDDLYYRLNVVTIPLPPLRSRGRDIEELARYFLAHYNKTYHKQVRDISNEVLNVFQTYQWHGNVRELENVMERATIFCQSDCITVKDLPEHMTALKSYHQVGGMKQYKADAVLNRREAAENALEKYEGNVSKAAAYLGVSRPTLYKWMRIYHIRKRQDE